MKTDRTITEHIVYVAAKSGGHIIPALTLAHQAKQRNATNSISYITTTALLDNHILKEYPWVDTLITLPLTNVPNTWLRRIWYFFLVLHSFFICLRFFIRRRPDHIVSMGGYVSIPVCLAGWILRIPITIWELNVIPGNATYYLQWSAQKIYVCFESAQRYFSSNVCQYRQYPLRYMNQVSREQAQKLLQFDPSKKTIFILGGSQGSVQLNQLFIQWLDKNSNAPSLQIIHQTGNTHYTDWQRWYHNRNICAHVFAFEQNIELYYQASDLIICRAGSGTLHEIAWLKIPCIIIPLRTSETDHQYYNALAMSQQYPYMQTTEPTQLIQKLDEWFGK